MKSAFSLKAFWPLAKVGTALGVAVLILNLALLAAAGTPMLAWLPERQTGTGFLSDNRQRVAGAEKELAREKVPSATPLAAIVGISNTREGFDLATLDRATNGSWRFIGLGGAGAGTPSIVEQADILLESRLRPKTVIIGVMPLQMMDTLVIPARAEALTAQRRPADFATTAKQAVKDALWLVRRRQDVSLAVERALLDARHSLFAALSVDVTTRDTRSPWRPMMRVLGAERYPDSEIQAGLAWAESLHAFDISTYSGSVVGPQVLGDLIDKLRARGSDVVVVYTPEHPQLHRRLPRGVTEPLNRKLNTRQALDRKCVILDMRAGFDETMFVDLVHLNTRGSHAFSEQFAQAFSRIENETFRYPGVSSECLDYMAS